MRDFKDCGFDKWGEQEVLKSVPAHLFYDLDPSSHWSAEGEFCDLNIMKLPKETNRYCPYCRAHTGQVVATAKQRSRSATHPLSRGSPTRIKARSLQGIGNWGKRSKKGAKDWKRKTKITKRISIVYKCKKCGKMKGIKKAIRVSRIEIGEKVAK